MSTQLYSRSLAIVVWRERCEMLGCKIHWDSSMGGSHVAGLSAKVGHVHICLETDSN